MPVDRSAAAEWFRATEMAGDFMGIRFGRIDEGAEDVEWIHVSHVECDGVGAFARCLRERGARVPVLPQIRQERRGVVGPILRLLWSAWRGRRGDCMVRDDWDLVDGENASGPPPSIAWQVFSKAETARVLDCSRQAGVTVNSGLLQHLDRAVRPSLRRPELGIPWMIPVNLRGACTETDDTHNHVSCVDVRIAAGDNAVGIQEQIHRRIDRGEHWANYHLMSLGRFMTEAAKVRYLTRGRSKPEGNLGAFSNLGAWDPEQSIDTRDHWLFCPPVVSGQLLGAGCVTFQNRLSLVIQSHAAQQQVDEWLGRWVAGIKGNG